jgi:hypothetical protein
METRGPPPGQGISFTSATRRLCILRRHRGDPGHLGTTPRSTPNLERHLKRTVAVTMVGGNGTTEVRRGQWTVGHKTVNLFPDETGTSDPHIMCVTGPGPQKHTVKIPSTPGLPKAVRTTIEQYLKLTDWVSLHANQESQNNDRSWSSSPEIVACQESQQSVSTPSTDTERLIQNLIHEHSEAILPEELEDKNHTFSHNTLLSWLIKILTPVPRYRQNTETTGARFHTLQSPREIVCSSRS